MATVINGTTGIDKIQDGTVVDADIASLAASKLTGDLPAIDGSALTGITTGKVLQTVSYVYDGNYSYTTSTSYTITPLSLAITPSSTSSKILVMVSQAQHQNAQLTQIRRGGTALTTNLYNRSTSGWAQSNMLFLDSPSTTSATTYSVHFRSNSGTGTYWGGDTGYSNTIVLMEIAG